MALPSRKEYGPMFKSTFHLSTAVAVTIKQQLSLKPVSFDLLEQFLREPFVLVRRPCPGVDSVELLHALVQVRAFNRVSFQNGVCSLLCVTKELTRRGQRRGEECLGQASKVCVDGEVTVGILL
eukprot:1763199-Amphidinium_carterae.1